MTPASIGEEGVARRPTVLLGLVLRTFHSISARFPGKERPKQPRPRLPAPGMTTPNRHRRGFPEPVPLEPRLRDGTIPAIPSFLARRPTRYRRRPLVAATGPSMPPVTASGRQRCTNTIAHSWPPLSPFSAFRLSCPDATLLLAAQTAMRQSTEFEFRETTSHGPSSKRCCALRKRIQKIHLTEAFFICIIHMFD